MVDVIIVSHGNYAKALVESSELIMGEQERVHAIGFMLGENVDELRARIEKKIEDLKKKYPEDGLLILTDIKSGSPFNAVTFLMQNHRFIHITGVNLPIFIEIIGTREFQTAEELREMVMSIGKDTIVDVNKLMEAQML